MPVWLTRNWWRERARDGGAMISVCLGFASGLLYAVIELAAAGVLTAASLCSDAFDVARWPIENPPTG